jgi:hypothetical protein
MTCGKCGAPLTSDLDKAGAVDGVGQCVACCADELGAIADWHDELQEAEAAEEAKAKTHARCQSCGSFVFHFVRGVPVCAQCREPKGFAMPLPAITSDSPPDYPTVPYLCDCDHISHLRRPVCPILRGMYLGSCANCGKACVAT